MPKHVFPQKKPSLTPQQALQEAIAHCKAGQWKEAQSLYHALLQLPTVPLDAQYLLVYVDALIQAGLRAVHNADKPDKPANAAPEQPRPVRIRPARAPNPHYLVRQARWPWKTFPDAAQQPAPARVHQLLACYQRGAYAEAETMARSMTLRYPHYAQGWKVLGAALQMQGKTSLAKAVALEHRAGKPTLLRKNIRLS